MAKEAGDILDEKEKEEAPFDVAVIGYGPVGVTLAALLGRAGLRVGVFEKSREIFAQPRAVGFDHDAMRIFQRIGVADQLAPHIAPFSDGEYFGVGGRLIRRVRRIPPPYPLTWDPNYTCDQPGMEAVLRGAVARFANVRVYLGEELTAMEDDGIRVRLALRDATGTTRRRAARYVVACDGASSPVRRMLGIAFDSMQYDEPWVVVDVRVEDEHLATLPATNVQYCQPEQPCTFITCPGNHRRWEFMMERGAPTEGALSEERLWQLLSRWLKPGQAKIWRASAYQFHALIARDWRRGRVLLAGDAAHQTPPFLGQGMCQGLRDTVNLAWKLDLVVRGKAPDALLDSYTEERRPHVVETTRMAKEIGQLISERDPERARLRDERIYADNGGEAPTVLRQDMIPGLSAGLIAIGTPKAGKVFPQPMVKSDTDDSLRLLDDLAEPCARLVICSDGDTPLADAAGTNTLIAAARAQSMLVQVLRATGAIPPRIDGVAFVQEKDGLLHDWFAAAPCRGALVRPDHYVFGGFNTVAEAVALVQAYSADIANQTKASEYRS